MANSATNINKTMFVSVPSQYFDFQRYMSWSLLWSAIFRSEVVVCFDKEHCYWYWWNCWPSWLKLSFHNHISHRIVEYKKHHWLSIFMFCKLQHGKVEGIWYLQISESRQVVECAWLDWCNLIFIQITTKYKNVQIQWQFETH